VTLPLAVAELRLPRWAQTGCLLTPQSPLPPLVGILSFKRIRASLFGLAGSFPLAQLCLDSPASSSSPFPPKAALLFPFPVLMVLSACALWRLPGFIGPDSSVLLPPKRDHPLHSTPFSGTLPPSYGHIIPLRLIRYVHGSCLMLSLLLCEVPPPLLLCVVALATTLLC
jgi:hypothetical protein